MKFFVLWRKRENWSEYHGSCVSKPYDSLAEAQKFAEHQITGNTEWEPVIVQTCMVYSYPSNIHREWRSLA